MSAYNNDLKDLYAVAKLAMDFGLVNRATRHANGAHESDTTHTVMLQMALLSLTDLLQRNFHFDIGLAIQLALVHDIGETYVGDVNTGPGASPEEVAGKAEKERLAWLEIQRSTNQPMRLLMGIYANQNTVEAQVVKYLDKVLPKLTHSFNGGIQLIEEKVTPEKFREFHENQFMKLSKQFPKVHDVLGPILKQAMLDAEEALQRALEKQA